MGRAYQNRKESMAKTAAAKPKSTANYGREFYMCAKSGGVDRRNLSLRGMIDQAKRDQVPSHVIEKAIEKKPKGRRKVFRPAMKDSALEMRWSLWVFDRQPNRTFNDVRQCFTKVKAKLVLKVP